MLTLAGLAVALSRGGSGEAPRGAQLTAASATAPGHDGTPAKFRYLARQTSNRCDLQPAALATMPDGMRLQGSCCSPMDLAAYRSQVRGLRAYRAMVEIPRDPYDVPVSLGKRLLAYDHAIHLTPAQAYAYRRAMRMSDQKGPCCCRCWRWYAFRGLSKHLIADRHWWPAQVARVIDLVEGCGGPTEHA